MEEDTSKNIKICKIVRNYSNKLLSTLEKIDNIICEKDKAPNNEKPLKKIESIEKLNITSY
jgi:hypothetical protein